MFDVAGFGAGGEVVLEFFDVLRRAFGQNFDAPVREVAHVAGYLMPRRHALREITIPDPLHYTADEILACDPHAQKAKPENFDISKTRYPKRTLAKNPIARLRCEQFDAPRLTPLDEFDN